MPAPLLVLILAGAQPVPLQSFHYAAQNHVVQANGATLPVQAMRVTTDRVMADNFEARP